MPEEKLKEELRQAKEQSDKRIELLENLVFDLIRTTNYKFSKNIQMQDGRNVEINTGTGTKIGTATGQKLSLWNATPIIQPASASQAAIVGTADGTYSANEVTLINDIVTLLNQIRSDLVSVGIIKGSA